MKADIHIIRIKPLKSDVDRYYDEDERRARKDRLLTRRFQRRARIRSKQGDDSCP